MEEEQEVRRQEVHGNYNAISGSGPASVHVHQPPVPSVLPERVWMVPYRRNGFFTGRETLLAALHERFTTDQTAVITQGQAINGLGGIGKTQVAVEYAYRHKQDYRFVLWASAATHETLISAFVSIADGLQLPERTLKEQDKIVAAVQRWLSTHEGWLLIVDNADELGMVWPFLPMGSTGHVLVTTRSQAVADMENFLVEKMDRSEGTLLLLRRAHILKPGMELDQVSLANRQVAEQIVAEMDGLPLALDQAGAYIKETPCSLSDYLSLYRTRRAELLKERGSLVNDYPESVATTWSISFQKVEQKSSAAADLLRLCAFLAPDAIPEEIITAGAEHLGQILQVAARDPMALNKAIAALGAYSLIRRDPAEKALSIHRLVQAVLLDSLTAKAQQQWMQRAIQATVAAYTDATRRNWAQRVNRALKQRGDRPNFTDIDGIAEGTHRAEYERLLPHMLQCVAWIEHGQFDSREVARVFDLAGLYLDRRGRYAEAEPLLQCALEIREEQLGTMHPATAESLNNLAKLYIRCGRYVEAESLLQRALAVYEEQLEATDPDTATNLSNLAMLYMQQGKYAQAEPLLQRALKICAELLGHDHPDTATKLNNLAMLYMQQGKYAQAEPLYQCALTIYEQRLGATHPYTAQSLNNLAVLYMQQRKYAQAEPLLQRALEIREEQLGLNHPHTAQSLTSLAMSCRGQGKYAQAELLYQRALTTYEQLLGPDHPDTATCLNNLAFLYDNQGKYEQAEPLHVRALAIREQQLGPHHPNTANSLNNLAELYRNQGKYEQAEPLYQRAIAILEQTLGPHHPNTKVVRQNYAALLRAMGRDEEVKQIEEQQ